MAGNHLSLGRSQLEIMRVLWRLKKATARQVTDELNRDRPTAHSTVQTLLRLLERKGVVKHDVVERVFVFYPLIEPDDATRHAARDVIERMFDGSPAALVRYVIENEQLKPEELGKIETAIHKRRDKTTS